MKTSLIRLAALLLILSASSCSDKVYSSSSLSSEQSSSSMLSSESSSVSSIGDGAQFPASFTEEQKTYYAGVEGLKGTDLKYKLHDIINKNFTGISYGDARSALSSVDEDPNDSTRVIEVYTRYSVLKTDSLFNGNSSGFWNREHCWPQSRMNTDTDNSTIGRGSDIHGVHASDSTTNGARGNLNYYDFDAENAKGFTYTTYKCRDASGNATTATSQARYSASLGFEPPDAGKGDSARAVLYMAVMYPDYCTLSNTASQSSSNELGGLKYVLNWNLEDLPDTFEIGRNEKVYKNYQHNRNPFIDAPEWANLIFD